MSATRGGGTGTKERSLLRRLREHAGPARWVAIGALVVAVFSVLVVAGLPGVGDGDDGPPPPPARIADTRSSWVPGQASLATSPAYAAIVGRAETLAGERAGARDELLERIAEAKKKARERERAKARDRYLALRRAALARYRAALRQNAKDRAEAAKRRAAALAAYRAKLKKYRESLIVRPGEECKLPNVKQRIRCLSGLLPHDPLPGE